MQKTPTDPMPGPSASSSSSLDSMRHLAEAIDLDTVLHFVGTVTYTPNPDPRSKDGIDVDVTYIDTPHLFYVRPTKFRQLMPTLQTATEHLDDESLYNGMIVAFRSKQLHVWLRGKIINITSENDCKLYDLFTLDYGFIETQIKTKRIFKTLYASVQPLVRCCFLAECFPLVGDEFSVEAINAMKSFTEGMTCNMRVIANTRDYLVVKLSNNTTTDLALLLALTEHTSCGGNVNAINRHYVPKSEPAENTVTFRSLAVGDRLYVRIQGGKSFEEFYVAESDAYKKYMSSRSDLTYHCRKLGKVDFKELSVGDTVAVPNGMFNNYFERAIIKKIWRSETVNLQLIDWGRILEFVPVTALFNMSVKFMDTPAVAIYCRIEGDPGPTKMMQGFPMKIEIKKVGDGFNTPCVVTPIL